MPEPDHIQAFIDAMLARRAAKKNPLVAPPVALPALTGDVVEDAIAQRDAIAAARVNPLHPRKT